MESIEKAILLPGATSFDDSNINPTWKGHVRTASETVVVYAKKISPREICVESFCALLGRALGLPIPKPYLILADNTAMDGIPEGHHVLMFGSADADFPSFRRHANCQEALNRLASFKASLDVGVFDEWIANWDRNIGNILYDGGNDFLFIDHGVALAEGLSPALPARDNQLLRCLFSIKTEIEKYRDLRTSSTEITPQYRSLELNEVMDKTSAYGYLESDKIDEILSFLDSRLAVIENLVKTRLCISQTDMFDGH